MPIRDSPNDATRPNIKMKLNGLKQFVPISSSRI